MPISYTIGQWTVQSHEVDSISATKNVAVPDVDYVHDFTLASSDATSARLINTSGSGLESTERIGYQKARVDDIYRKVATLKSNQLPSPVGARISVETTEILSATHATTGAELSIPIRIWTCMESSTHNTVTGAALLWALKRHLSHWLGTGTVDEALLIRLFRGDLDPTR